MEPKEIIDLNGRGTGRYEQPNPPYACIIRKELQHIRFNDDQIFYTALWHIKTRKLEFLEFLSYDPNDHLYLEKYEFAKQTAADLACLMDHWFVNVATMRAPGCVRWDHSTLRRPNLNHNEGGGLVWRPIKSACLEFCDRWCSNWIPNSFHRFSSSAVFSAWSRNCPHFYSTGARGRVLYLALQESYLSSSAVDSVLSVRRFKYRTYRLYIMVSVWFGTRPWCVVTRYHR
jgi:hypothetical protein